MALTNAFNEAVYSGAIRRVRIMMKDSLLVDPSLAQFEEMNKVASGMQGLYEEHDGRNFNLDKSTWDVDYINKMMIQVVSNFSHERVDHLKEVVRYLNPVLKEREPIHASSSSRDCSKTESYASSRYSHQASSKYQEQKYADQQDGNYRVAKITAGVITGSIAGGIVVSVAGCGLASTVIGTVVGGAVGGVVISAIINERN